MQLPSQEKNVSKVSIQDENDEASDLRNCPNIHLKRNANKFITAETNNQGDC